MSTGLQGHSILIVEDEPLIALELRRSIEKAGAHVFASTQLPFALRLADHPDLSAALVDYRMGDEDVAPLCARLEQRGVPFIFYTGYLDVVDHWPNAIILSKPCTEADILAALSNVLAPTHIHPRSMPAGEPASA